LSLPISLRFSRPQARPLLRPTLPPLFLQPCNDSGRGVPYIRTGPLRSPSKRKGRRKIAWRLGSVRRR
jgi:hypothetical protein